MEAQDYQHELKQRFTHQQSIVNNLAGKQQQYIAAKTHAARTETDAKQLSDSLQQVTAHRQALAEQLSRLEARRLRNKFFPQRAHHSETRLRNQLHIAIQSSIETKAQAYQAEAAANHARLWRDQLHRDAKALRTAEMASRNLLEQIFRGEPGSERENQLEKRRNELAKYVDGMRKSHKTQSEVLQLLYSAADDLSAVRATFGPSRFSLSSAPKNQRSQRNPTQSVDEAQKKIQQAVLENAQLPIAQDEKINDDVFVDVKDVTSVDHAIATLKASIAHQEDIVENLEDKFKERQDEYKKTTQELNRERLQLLSE